MDSEQPPLRKDPDVFPRSWTRAVLAAVLGLLALGLAWSGVADRVGEQSLEAGLQRALIAFGLARTLNGVISVVQGPEVAVQPAGIDVNLAPGEILDPVNDLVERFSWVMLVASTALGVERLLLEVLAWPGVTLAIGLLFGLLAAAQWLRSGWLAQKRGWLLRLALFVLVLRFLVPALAYVGEAVHERFVAPRFDEAVAELEDVSGQIDQLREPAAVQPGPEAGLSERLKRWFEDTGQTLDVSERLAEVRDIAARAVDRTIELTAIFVFQTLVFPLVFLWLVRAGYRMLVRAWHRGPGV